MRSKLDIHKLTSLFQNASISFLGELDSGVFHFNIHNMK
jgi:hypothetical protein